MTPADQIRAYVVASHLEGRDDVALDERTPLLELAILDSFAIFGLVDFLHRDLGVRVPHDRIEARNFGTIGAIARLVEELSRGAAGNGAPPKGRVRTP